MVLTTISKQFRWEMGHRLPFHNGLCKNIHGHSYQARVAITGTTDKYGMVLDYFDMKTIIQPIIDELDHCFLCDSSDHQMITFFTNNPMKVVYIHAPTTAENIALYLLNRIEEQLLRYSNITGVRVTVFETENSFAEVHSPTVK